MGHRSCQVMSVNTNLALRTKGTINWVSGVEISRVVGAWPMDEIDLVFSNSREHISNPNTTWELTSSESLEAQYTYCIVCADLTRYARLMYPRGVVFHGNLNDPSFPFTWGLALCGSEPLAKIPDFDPKIVSLYIKRSTTRLVLVGPVREDE